MSVAIASVESIEPIEGLCDVDDLPVAQFEGLDVLIELCFDIGTSADWISPMLAAMADVQMGPNVTFFAPYGIGLSGLQIVTWLHRHGIATWGHMIVNRMIMFTVKCCQARWATYLISKLGIPFARGR